MHRFLLILLVFSISFGLNAQFLEKKEDLKNYEGYFNFHYSEKDDEIFLKKVNLYLKLNANLNEPIDALKEENENN